jgi:hypothetical protein
MPHRVSPLCMHNAVTPGLALATGSAQLRSQLHVQSAGMGKAAAAFQDPAGLLTVEEARARSAKVPVTGGGSLSCAGTVFGPGRQLPCRAKTPSPGGGADVGDAEPATECDQSLGTERAAC